MQGLLLKEARPASTLHVANQLVCCAVSASDKGAQNVRCTTQPSSPQAEGHQANGAAQPMRPGSDSSAFDVKLAEMASQRDQLTAAYDVTAQLATCLHARSSIPLDPELFS